jgi:hypothetical protein
MQMPAIFDFLQPADPESEERQWSDVPIGMRLGALGSIISNLSLGRHGNPNAGVASLALLDRAGQQTQEERKAAKRKKMLQTYYSNHPNPQMRKMAEMGIFDEEMMAAVLKDEMGFERYKMEKDYEQKLAKQKADETLRFFNGGGGAAPGGTPATMPSGSAELSGSPAPTQAAGGWQLQNAEEQALVAAMSFEGKGTGEIAQALTDLRMKRQQEARMMQGEERQQSAEIDRRGSEIGKDLAKAPSPFPCRRPTSSRACRATRRPVSPMPRAHSRSRCFTSL